MRRALAVAGILLFACVTLLFAVTQVNGVLVFLSYFDMAKISTPSNPAAGYLRLYANTTTGQIACVDSSGSSCIATGGGGGGYKLLESHSASSSSSLDFTTCISGSYQTYKLVILDLVPSTNANFLMRVSTDGGMNWVSTASYSVIRSGMSTSNGGAGAGGTAQTSMQGNSTAWTTTAGWSIEGEVQFYAPAASPFKQFHGRIMGITTGSRAAYDFFGVYEVATAVNAVQILPSAGTWTSGTIQCYGLSQ